MATSLSPSPKTRLKQVPIDVWSTREKLCLASNVLKSGDQNWASFIKPLKSFAEPNRPSDWFNQKNCATQYNDLLEKIKPEIPKRKRGERGEDTAEDLIVKKLTKERIEELRKILPLEKEKLEKLREECEIIKNEQITEEKKREIMERMEKEKKLKEEEKIEHEKWLKEREAKIALMKTTRFVAPSKQIRGPNMQINLSSKGGTPNIKGEDGSIGSPLSVDTGESGSNASQAATNIVIEPKLSMPTTPSTSPLLTSLLQSPTPSTSSITSPILLTAGQLKDNTSPPSVVTRQSPSSNQSHPPFFPQLSTSTQKQFIIGASSSTATSPNALLSSGDKTPTHAGTSNIVPSSSPTLSKLLEMPPSTPGKLPSLPLIESQLAHQAELERKSPSKAISPGKTTQPRKEADQDVVDKEQMDVRMVEKELSLQERNVNPIEKEKAKDRMRSAVKERQSSTEEKEKEKDLADKESAMENKSDDIKIQVKQEPMDTSSSGDAAMATPSMTTRAKRKRPTPTVSNVSATRRSGRVKALRESSGTQDESSSEPTSLSSTPLNVTQTYEKRASVDETATETSMSEESQDAARPVIPAPPSTTLESVPNSPASSSMLGEDPESIKEYKAWKKSIMVTFRLATSHKYASSFLTAVTDDEASGYSEIVHRPMNLNLIKKKLEEGKIRTTAEFERDMMLLFLNAIMYNKSEHNVHQEALEMQKEVLESIEDFKETQMQLLSSNTQMNETKLRVRERRSGVSTSITPTVPTPSTSSEDRDSIGRRRSRVGSNDAEVNTTPAGTKSIKKKVASSNVKN